MPLFSSTVDNVGLGNSFFLIQNKKCKPIIAYS